MLHVDLVPFASVAGYTETVLPYHSHWNELHREVRTEEQFESWVRRVPNFGCGCEPWLREYVAKHPYPVDRVQPEVLLGLRTLYGWTLHNAVNAKLRGQGFDRPEFTWAEFEVKYLSPMGDKQS